MLDGIGVGLAVWFQGCSKKCKNCHNPKLQKLDGGFEHSTEATISYLDRYKNFYESLILLGGEPLEQIDAVYDIISNLKNKIPVILYTGWLYEDIPAKLLPFLKIVIDGPYIDELNTGGFPASSNQRIFIDGKRSKNDFRRKEI